MKKTLFLSTAILLGAITLYSCKGNKKQDGQVTAPTNTETPAETKTTTGSAEPKTYVVSATPDSATLGKNKEVSVKVKNVKAIELSDPEGKVTGIQLAYDLEVTNKSAIGSGSIVIDPDKFRLELDNGTKISHDLYSSVGVDAESTKSSVNNTFKLPAGTKPVALNLFFDETRAIIKLEMK